VCGEHLLTFSSEIFGTSEDESPELDHSEDSENGTSLMPGSHCRTNKS